MSRSILKAVTISGADDSVDTKELLEISRQFPWVEWGILVSKAKEGKPRYPSFEWQTKLFDTWAESFDAQMRPRMRLSVHLCGFWCREVIEGRWTFLKDRLAIWPMFGRVQLNHSHRIHSLLESDIINLVKALVDPVTAEKQFIFQMKQFDCPAFDAVLKAAIDAVPFFDRSGGKGKVAPEWPEPRVWAAGQEYCGYAGGLNCDNIVEQLTALSAVVEKVPVWIDMETGAFTEDRFDTDKVRRYLDLSRPWTYAG